MTVFIALILTYEGANRFGLTVKALKLAIKAGGYAIKAEAWKKGLMKKFIHILAFGLTVTAATANAAPLSDIPMTNDRGETAFMIDIRLKPGTEDEFENIVLRSVRCTRLEPGNLTYNIHKVYKTTGQYILYEVWRTQEHFRRHLERPYAKKLTEFLDTAMDPPLDRSLRFLGDFAPDIRLDPISTDPNRMADCKD